MAKVGRPTSYKPEYCEQVIELGKLGYSPVQMAAHFDIARTTLILWQETHPEFMTALTRAMAHCQAWWEAKGMEYMTLPGFNATVWVKSMQARFRDDYTERKVLDATVAHTHEDMLSQLDDPDARAPKPRRELTH